MSDIVNLKEISERFNNGTETIEDIINYCRNYEITFENDITIRIVEKKYFDKLVERIQELEQENRIQRRQINSAFDRGWILKQKVKDLIENETINISGFECIAVEDLEELLEDK